MTEREGLFNKYVIAKADGSPVDPQAEYFVLRLDTEPQALESLMKYADLIYATQPVLASALYQRIMTVAQQYLESWQQHYRNECIYDENLTTWRRRMHAHYGQVDICPVCGRKGAIDHWAQHRIVHREVWMYRDGHQASIPLDICVQKER